MIWKRRGLVRGFSSAAPVLVIQAKLEKSGKGPRRDRACVKINRNCSSRPFARRRGIFNAAAAFSLIETMVGLMMLVIAASSIFFAYSQANRIASVARLYTEGQFIVQSQINTIQSDSPFIPQSSEIPTELTLGVTSTTGIPVYVDPATGNTVVSGSMTTTVTNLSHASLSEYAYQATVQLNYAYRGRSYQIIESTVRGSDQ